MIILDPFGMSSRKCINPGCPKNEGEEVSPERRSDGTNWLFTKDLYFANKEEVFPARNMISPENADAMRKKTRISPANLPNRLLTVRMGHSRFQHDLGPVGAEHFEDRKKQKTHQHVMPVSNSSLPIANFEWQSACSKHIDRICVSAQ